MKSIKLFTCICCIALFLSCNDDKKEKEISLPAKDSAVVVSTPIINKDSLLASTGKEILTTLKSKQYDSLIYWFSDSVQFSPYGFIGSGSQTLTAKDFSDLLSNNKKINWGEYDGSGEPIDLTLKQYLEKFVYNADYLHAEKTAVDSFIKTGNSLDNLKSVYPGARFMEYHFSGFDKQYAGMDWTTLRLVFIELKERYLLAAIIHSQWTI